MILTLFSVLSVLASVSGTPTPDPLVSRADPDNDGIHLAVSPNCGALSGNVSDVNAGVDLSVIKTIVIFGDSYSCAEYLNGTTQPPAILGPPPATMAAGRRSDGPMWIEDVADDLGAVWMDYAHSGAVTNVTLWPDDPTASDFPQQMAIFLGQDNVLDPDSTLYTIFFGINDYGESTITGTANMPAAAQTVLNEIDILAGSPTKATTFLIADDYGRGSSSAAGQAYKQKIFDGLLARQKASPSNFKFAYVDFQTIWDGVLGTDPGYAAFGYNSTSGCLGPDNLRADECSDPAGYFYWLAGHPSLQTHRIMADYTEEVLQNCVV